jgi:hypothetical protein
MVGSFETGTFRLNKASTKSRSSGSFGCLNEKYHIGKKTRQVWRDCEMAHSHILNGQARTYAQQLLFASRIEAPKMRQPASSMI